MKHISLPVGLSLLLTATTMFAQTGDWEELNTGTTKNIRDLFFATPQVGYAVGDDSLFIKTTDGGDTWIELNFPDTAEPLGNDGNIQCIWFTTENDGVLAYPFIEDVIVTGNGGVSWGRMLSNLNYVCYPKAFYFFGPLSGIMVGRGCFGGGAIILYGGFGWYDSQLLYFDNDGLNDVTADASGNTVLVAGDNGWLLRSTDMFASDIDTISLLGDTSDIQAVDYAGNNTFYASGSRAFYPVYKSTDGGVSFQVDSTMDPTFFYPEIHELDFIDENWGIAAATANITNGVIVHKTGNYWTYTPTTYPVNSVHVVDSTLAFVGGEGGKIYRYKKPGLNVVENENTLGYQVYPNPVSSGSMVTIQLPEGNTVKGMDVVDMQGRTICRSVIQNGQNFTITYKIPDLLLPGIYLLRLETENGFLTRRLIVR